MPGSSDMAIKPRKTEAKKLMPILEQDFDSPEDAAIAILSEAYELYEGQAKFYVVGQVRPNTGWKSPEEGRDAKTILGPFGTRKQAEDAGHALAYSSATGEESSWWAVEAWHGTPAAWYSKRKETWQREGFLDGDPRHQRMAMAEDWIRENPGTPLPDILKPNGWEGLDDFQVWFEVNEGKLDDYDLKTVIRQQQAELDKLRNR